MLRSMKKTASDRMENIDQNNPENGQPQSILSSAYNKSPNEYAEENNSNKIKHGM